MCAMKSMLTATPKGSLCTALLLAAPPIQAATLDLLIKFVETL